MLQCTQIVHVKTYINMPHCHDTLQKSRMATTQNKTTNMHRHPSKARFGTSCHGIKFWAASRAVLRAVLCLPVQ